MLCKICYTRTDYVFKKLQLNWNSAVSPKNVNRFGKEQLGSEASKINKYVWLDRKNRKIDFETSLVKTGWKLIELFAQEDTIPWFAETRWLQPSLTVLPLLNAAAFI